MVAKHIFVQKYRVQQYKFTVIECMMRPMDFNR